MNLWIDVKFTNMLSPYLSLFKKKSNYLWNFRCPICGDSKKNVSKSRGFIYKPARKNYLTFKCHNCNVNEGLSEFIQRLNPELYKEYMFEVYREKNELKVKEDDSLPEIFKEIELSDSVLDSLHRLDKLSDNHPAVKYILNRKIPRELHFLFYFTGRFKQYVNSLIPNKFTNLDNDIPRLVIPYFNKFGKCFAFQGRAFGSEEPKYITIKLDENQDRIYGLDRVDFSKHIYVVEGPIDSIFLPNALAVSGASYDCDTINLIKTNCTIVPDNEPRNKDVNRLIQKAINQNFKVCLWPESFNHKDINDAVKGDLTSDEIVNIINQNTYQGASAKLRFVNWKKC